MPVIAEGSAPPRAKKPRASMLPAPMASRARPMSGASRRFRGAGLFRCDRHRLQLLPRYFPTAFLSVSALRSSALLPPADISGQITSLTPSRPTTLGSESATS